MHVVLKCHHQRAAAGISSTQSLVHVPCRPPEGDPSGQLILGAKAAAAASLVLCLHNWAQPSRALTHPDESDWNQINKYNSGFIKNQGSLLCPPGTK